MSRRHKRPVEVAIDWKKQAFLAMRMHCEDLVKFVGFDSPRAAAYATYRPLVDELFPQEPATSEQFLKALEEERGKTVDIDDDHIDALIQWLVNAEEYPADTLEGNPNTIRQMVDGWGAYWHRWTGILECAVCGEDLRDKKIGPPFKLYSIRKKDNGSILLTCPECLGDPRPASGLVRELEPN